MPPSTSNVPVTDEQVAAAKAVSMGEVLRDSGIELEFDSDTPQQFRCPLHGDGIDKSGRGSARLYPDANGAKCWGCGEWYDTIGWVEKFHSLDFPEAVRFLCREYVGLDVDSESGRARQPREIEGRTVLEVLEEESRLLFPLMTNQQRIAISQTLDKLWAVGCSPQSQERVDAFLGRIRNESRSQRS